MIGIGPVMLALVAAASSTSPSAPLFEFHAEAGPHAVGLRVIEQYDYSRTYRGSTDKLGRSFAGERARPLQTLVWYPAVHSSRNGMTVADYARLLATEVSFGHPKMTAKAKERVAGMRPSLGARLWAVRDAPPAAGSFPIVIYAPGFSGVAWENADLCEYLASHGYVVLASPDMGSMTREMTYDLEGINTQARDISFLIGYAATLSNTDRSEVGVIGYSWGGISNLFAAARDSRIDALVSLDGSLRYSPGLVKQAGDVHPERMAIPLLSFAQRDFSFEDQDRELTDNEKDGPNVLNAWTHGDLVEVHLFGLVHASLSSMAQRNEDTWWELFNVRPLMQGDYGRADAMTGYEWMARYTLTFLDAYLKHEQQAGDFLKKQPAENGVPQHVLAVNYRGRSGMPLSLDGFRAAVAQQGFNHVDEVYASFKRRNSEFKLSEDALAAWSKELIDDDHVNEALNILKLNMSLHRESSGAAADLADAYVRSGQRQLAMETYAASLEKDPLNAVARRKLQELRPAVAAAAPRRSGDGQVR